MRTIRSFVRRSGRLTPSQERALAEHWPAYGLEFSNDVLDLQAIFGRAGDCVLEIGFGDGESLVDQATSHPELDFIGIEVHRPGIGHCLLLGAAAAIGNLRIISHDAAHVLEQQIADRALTRINLYFPDPWPKTRHHKRRIVQADFLELAAAKLEPGGAMHVATDWEPYAEHIDEVLARCDSFAVAQRHEHAGDAPLDRPTTKFERRGLNQGHKIVDWRLLRN